MREELIYHYTSLPAFHDIISSKELWATSIHYLNDSSEFKHAIDICKREAKPILNNIFFAALSQSLEQISDIHIFVSSFSREADLLSQWRGYCRPNGVSIGFSIEKLSQIAETQGYKLLPCIYEEKGKKNKIIELLNTLKKEAKSQGQGLVISNFLSLFCSVGATFKNSSFIEEQEYRLISFPISSGNDRYNIRATSSMLIPYHRFNLDPLNKTKIEKTDIALRELVIGPNPHQELIGIPALHHIDKNHILMSGTRYSRIPYREFN